MYNSIFLEIDFVVREMRVSLLRDEDQKRCDSEDNKRHDMAVLTLEMDGLCVMDIKLLKGRQLES